ncbi:MULTISPECIES: peptidylprolyl isomerase [Rhizobium/Agrobacterium group]|uniref:Parvulin-like PPIase n=2 Tax=Rhizobium/Agrobacterium group TaxID=227290 RepID=B9JX62_ALLAM|nr:MULTISPECIES: peptidylprolyl isomerase [Rhizobium/Agrobacterium group]ACM36840.1 peptidyl-prolyl cis-trans isomerase [Allorhizobium ampelinum S4]MCF1446325.1 peptidylprolyl isomerase [Allorhizobium ampelinum]MCF1492793.1 peptidylprolyl isomerase [Allorhizobium ampelinum]MUO27241.1 peptidylprolyl isomerase [Agrobacterium vitis]MUO43217.1 peptidylprolyl isomerase [Agrobacterium vitis]
MLVILRKAAGTWVAKGLLLLLVASFAIWGISSSIMSDTSDKVIKVGSQSVNSNEFRLAYQRQISDLSRRFGTQLTSEQARSLGIESQVYQQLVAGAALDQLASDMNLGLSQDRLAQLIGDDPAFKNTNGQFDRQLFTSRLRNSGIREQDYITERSKVAVRSQIVDATAEGFVPPKVLIDALKLYRQESRSIDYLLLTTANIDPIKAPDETVLKTWFNTMKSRYRAPEYRSFSYVKLEPADIADPKAVTDEQVKQEYDANLKKFEVAGTRTLEQLTFPTKELAETAAQSLKNGKTFDQLVADQGKTATDVLLGDFTRADIPDQKLADAAFAVAKDSDTTPVVEGAFGPVILRVSNIKPSHTKTLDEVKDQIRADLAANAAAQQINDVHDRFEDMRASGSSLEEAATKAGLKAIKIDGIDAQGQDKTGKQAENLPEKANLLKSVFETEAGAEPLPLNIGRNGYLWFDVTSIDASRERTLDEVKDKAVSDWTTEQQKQALGAKVEQLKAKADTGVALADLATELAIGVETKAGLRRDTEDPVLGPAAVQAAFRGPSGTIGSAVGADPMTQILLKVTDVNTQPTGDVVDQQESQITALAKSAGDDILDQMVNQLQTKYGVTINQALAQQAITR